MNLSFLFVLALGALTGVPQAPPRAAVTVSVRAEKQVSVAGLRSPVAASINSGDRRPATGDPRIAAAPLTGSATPRAPALNC